MLAFTIWQPWASLVMIGAKPWEFREKSYLDAAAYRTHPDPGDRVVVHAGARPVRNGEVADLINKLGGRQADATGLDPAIALPRLERWWCAPGQFAFPLGCALGTAKIGLPARACDVFGIEVADSDRGGFNFAWPLSKIDAWHPPVHARGRQGFWRWPHALPDAGSSATLHGRADG